METILNEQKKELYHQFNEFTDRYVAPVSHLWEEDQKVSEQVIAICAENGFLGATMPEEYGGRGWDFITYGLLNEAVGKASVSLSGLFNVHTMVSQSLLKWGTADQIDHWLPLLSRGSLIGALALTEPAAGSDLKRMKTDMTLDGNDIVINGVKRWITFGARADLVLVFGKMHNQPTACLVPADTNGLKISHIKDMLGFKAAYLARLEFKDCRIPKENLLAKEGVAFAYLAPYALEFGRISVAWTALGIIRACLELCSYYSLKRITFDDYLINHGAVRAMIADMGVAYEASKLLCFNACLAKDRHQADATQKIMVAKYFCAKQAVKQASNAVQILGAIGCNENFSVARCYRDAKVLELIEGSNEIHQMILGKNFAEKNKGAVKSERSFLPD